VPTVALALPGRSAFSLDHVVHAVLVVGLAQEMCKYAVVRYTIYMSREFDEPMDGIIYMMACGTGFAVWVNYHRLSGQNHQVHLSLDAARTVMTTLAHASFAGLLGYAARGDVHDERLRMFNVMLWNFSPTSSQAKITFANLPRDLRLRHLTLDAQAASNDENIRLRPAPPARASKGEFKLQTELEPYGVQFWMLE